MAIGLIALDIDGTVTDSSHGVRPAVRSAIRAALDRGIGVYLATGRVLSTTRPVMEAVDPRLGALVNNGAAAYQRLDEPPLWAHNLSAATARDVVQVLDQDGLPAYVFDAVSEEIAVPAVDELPSVFAQRFAGRLRGVGDVAAWIRCDPLMVTTLAGADAKAERLIRRLTVELGQRFTGQASVSPLWHPLYGSWILDFVAPGVSKWRGLVRLAGLRGLEPSAILAVGDGLNDVEMVRKAGVGVAMGQACPELLAVADAVVADNDHDGVAEAIEQFALSVA